MLSEHKFIISSCWWVNESFYSSHFSLIMDEILPVYCTLMLWTVRLGFLHFPSIGPPSGSKTVKITILIDWNDKISFWQNRLKYSNGLDQSWVLAGIILRWSNVFVLYWLNMLSQLDHWKLKLEWVGLSHGEIVFKWTSERQSFLKAANKHLKMRLNKFQVTFLTNFI